MAYSVAGTCHRILEALDDGPLPFDELFEIVGGKASAFRAILKSMRHADMIEQDADMVAMTDRGADALDGLRKGLEFDAAPAPATPSVRLFPYERRAA